MTTGVPPISPSAPARPLVGGESRAGTVITTIGFATVVAQWTLSYLAMTSPGLVAGEILFVATLLVVVLGGIAIARLRGSMPGLADRPGWMLGAWVGMVSALVNLLVIGSLIGSGANALLWVGGLFVGSTALGAIGGAIGARLAPWSIARMPTPLGLFALLAATTVFLLLVTGGLVTGYEAGLAVPDWPNSFGHNMLLYPLGEMTGGIFYEHAHRLYGMLVGLTSLVLCVLVFRNDARTWVRVLAVAILLMVCVQGLMGGLRVTGNLTLSQDPSMLEPSTGLAIAHGMFGQLVFAAMAFLAAVTSRTWLAPTPPRAHAAGGSLRTFALVTFIVLVGQLFLGAALRHLQSWDSTSEALAMPAWALHGHITGAAIATAAAIVVGLRAANFDRDASEPSDRDAPGSRLLRRLGAAALILVGIQVCLGIAALVVVLLRRTDAAPVFEVILTSSHQVTGALLLATSAQLVAWSRRLLLPIDERAGVPAGVAATG